MSFIENVRGTIENTDRPPTSLTVPPGTWAATPYATAALQAELGNIARAANGTRNATLNRAAFNMAQLIAGGQISPEAVQDALVGAALAAGLDERETARTIRSGFAKGQQRARAAKPIEDVQLPTINVTTQDTEHTTWWPAQGGVTVQEDPPAHLQRDDGQHLFYAAKVNGLIGESESGKTWIALHAVTQALNTGHTVLYLDFEDTRAGITGRLKALGANLTTFHYADPSEGLHEAARTDLETALTTLKPQVVIVDGFNAAMTVLGLDLMSNRDATAFNQTLLRPLAATGACIVYVDHLPKNVDNQGKGGIGAQAKRAMTTGCAIRVDKVSEFSPTTKGILKLTVDKDRAGHVRNNSAGARHIGEAHIGPNLTGGTTITIQAPETHQPGQWRPTVLIERITELLNSAGPLSKRAIENEVKGRAEHIRTALDLMVQDGLATRIKGAHGALIYTSSSLVPSSSQVVPDEDNRPRPSSPTLGGDEDEDDLTGHRARQPRPEDEDHQLRWDQR